MQRCCRLDAVGRKRSQRTASEHPACDRHTAFIQRALHCSFSAHVRGIGCPFVAAIHPGASIHASFRRASAGVRCVVFGTCGRRQIVLLPSLAAKDTASQVHNKLGCTWCSGEQSRCYELIDSFRRLWRSPLLEPHHELGIRVSGGI